MCVPRIPSGPHQVRRDHAGPHAISEGHSISFYLQTSPLGLLHKEVGAGECGEAVSAAHLHLLWHRHCARVVRVATFCGPCGVAQKCVPSDRSRVRTRNHYHKLVVHSLYRSCTVSCKFCTVLPTNPTILSNGKNRCFVRSLLFSVASSNSWGLVHPAVAAGDLRVFLRAFRGTVG